MKEIKRIVYRIHGYKSNTTFAGQHKWPLVFN